MSANPPNGLPGCLVCVNALNIVIPSASWILHGCGGLIELKYRSPLYHAIGECQKCSRIGSACAFQEVISAINVLAPEPAKVKCTMHFTLEEVVSLDKKAPRLRLKCGCEFRHADNVKRMVEP